MTFTFPEMLDDWAKNAPMAPLWMVSRRIWRAGTVVQASQLLAQALLARGMEPGERVGLHLASTACWPAAVTGVWRAGGVVVPLDPARGDSEHRLELSGSRFLLTADTRIRGTGLRIHGGQVRVNRRIVSGTRPRLDSPAALLATSGTYGEPRLVTLTHGNLVYSCSARATLAEHRPGDLVLSWLPIHHSYAFNADLLKSIVARVPVRRILSPKRIIAAIRRFRPTHLHAVPRLYEKLHRLALNGHSLKALTGGRLRWAGCGGAPLPTWLSDFFHSHGMPLLEGYGLTEASPLVSLNTPTHHRPGTSGQIIPGTTVRLADNNEILVRGPGIMAGYWNDATATQTAISDGWLHTGDLGRIDSDGYLTIDGRTRELVVLSTGRKVPPLPAEAAAMALPWVDRAILCGHNQSHPVLLVWLTPEGFMGEIERTIMVAMAAIGAHLRPARVVVADRPLSVELGELTSLGKLRRDRIEFNWSHFVDARRKTTDYFDRESR